MHRAIPAVLVSAAAFVVVWRFEPTPVTVTVAPPATPSTGSGDQTVLGSAESTRYGTVRVQAVFSDGKLTDIQVLQAPNDRQTNGALPTLRAQALEVQSADIDTVTGATLTSEAYARSLQAAIDAKGN